MFKFLNLILRLFTLVILVTVVGVILNFVVLTATRSDITTSDGDLKSAKALVLYLPEDRWETELEHKLNYASDVIKTGKVETLFVFGTPKTVFNTEAFLELNDIDIDIVTNTSGLSVYDMVYALSRKQEVTSAIFIDQENRLNRTVYVAKRFDMAATGVRSDPLRDGGWQEMIREGLVTAKDFVVVHIYKYEPSSLK